MGYKSHEILHIVALLAERVGSLSPYPHRIQLTLFHTCLRLLELYRESGNNPMDLIYDQSISK